MSYIGTNKIGKMYLGGTEIAKAYLGSNLVYQNKLYDAEVEYLESTGGQLISSGVNYDNGAVNIELDVEILPNSTTGNSAVFGVGSSAGQWFGKSGQVYGCGATGSNSDINIGTRIIAGLVFGNGIRLTINGNYIGSRGSGVATRNFWLFRAGSNNAAPTMLYYTKIRDANNVMVRDFIPVRVGQVGYMYDKISGRLFGNAGSGNFIVGPDVVPR
jgi:hypothetical protein